MRTNQGVEADTMNAQGGRDVADTEEYSGLLQGRSRFYEAEPWDRMQVEVAGLSHPGLVRPNNEDHHVVVKRYRGRQVLASSVYDESLASSEDHAYVFAVADGMGGCQFGEIASSLAVRTGWELGGSEIKWAVKMNDREAEELREKAGVFFRLIEEALRSEVRENPELKGMGTTLTLCYSTGTELFVAHAGDSRAYLSNQGALKRLTRDHNLGQTLIDREGLEPDSPRVRRVRHVLTNWLGGADREVEVDFHRYQLADGDRLLLCTDGLNDMVSDAEIARLLEEHPAPADACRGLVDRALRNGGRDNVTAVVANFKVDGSASL